MFTRTRVLLVLVCAALAPALALPVRAEFDERFTLRAERLSLTNLVGEIDVVGHDGSDFEVEIRARGRDATRENLTVESREGASAEVSIRFPAEDRFVYPRLGAHSKTRFDMDDSGGGFSGFLASLFGGGGRVTVAGSGRGTELWADVTVRVPRDRALSILHGVGEIRAERIGGELSLSLRSGDVRIEDVEGQVDTDTGSGSVELSRVRGSRIRVDTGSGGIRLEDVQGGSLLLDTGSGSVRGKGLAADEAMIDTGSGSVSVGFVRIGDGRFLIDTGSGSIELSLPPDASARIRADTGSGGVEVDHPGAEVLHRDGGDAEIRVGGGATSIVLDTGSGSIRID